MGGAAFGWSLPMMHNIIVDSIYHSFCDEVTRDDIQKRLKGFLMQRNLDSFQEVWNEVNVVDEAEAAAAPAPGELVEEEEVSTNEETTAAAVVAGEAATEE